MRTAVFAAGGYRFIPAVFQYSGGVAAEPGFEIVRVRFHEPVPLAEGFARIEQVIRATGRPLTAFCACELRSPAPFTEDGFRAFNEIYAGTLQTWGVMTGDTNPVARSNVCPEIDPPAEPSFHAFCYTVAATGHVAHFRRRGQRRGGRGQGQLSRSHRAARRDLARRDAREGALRARRDGAAARRARLRAGRDTTASQVYTVHDLHPFLAGEIVRRGAARAGLTWHYARPPVRGLEYEMDCRAVGNETVI